MQTKLVRVTQKNEKMLKPREAILQLGISFPTIKQGIYPRKIKSVRTPGGHHRIPQSEIDRPLFRTRGKTAPGRREVVRRVSGRNHSWGGSIVCASAD